MDQAQNLARKGMGSGVLRLNLVGVARSCQFARSCLKKKEITLRSRQYRQDSRTG